MSYMSTGCWVFLGLLGISTTVGDEAENCITEFGGVGPGENLMTVDENNYINLTVSLQKAFGCDVDLQNNFHIRFSYQENNRSLDLCKFVFMTTCELSHSSKNISRCYCFNNRTFQIFQKAKSFDSGLYTWKWRHGKAPEKQRNIFINVSRASILDDTPAKTATTTVISLILSVVAVVIAVVVLWVRHKAKCTMDSQGNVQHYRWSVDDHLADNQVDGQTLSNENDPYYSVLEERVVSQNHDPTFVKEEYFNQHYDPYYSNIKELGSAQHYDPDYDDLIEQDGSQSFSLTNHEVRIKEGKVADEPYEACVNKQEKRNLDNPSTIRC